MKLHGETRNEVYLLVSDEHSEEPADINTISRKAQNTKDDYQKITVEGGREVFNGKDWKWFNQI